MKLSLKIILIIVVIFMVFMLLLPQLGISIPNLVIKQQDIPFKELSSHLPGKKVLIAARSSEFKDAVIQRVCESLQSDSISIKCIGLSTLKNEDIEPYDAILLINKTMAWNWDLNVKRFLRQNDNVGNVIILTTSGSGEWQPRGKNHEFDAIATASEKGAVNEVAGEILVKIDVLLR